MAQSRLLVKLAFLLFATMLSTSGSAQEIQVMVSGPWAYVRDPNTVNGDRIVLIAPVSKHHGPVRIFSGEYADQFAQQTDPVISEVGHYTLDFSSPSPCKSGAAPAGTYHLTGVSAGDVAKLITGPAPRFAISLPAPCSYSWQRQDWSKIDVRDPTTATETPYTTWMVLHYNMAGTIHAFISGSSDDNTLTYNKRLVDFTNDPGDSPSISIVLGTDSPYDTDRTCDSTSNASFRDAIGLFTNKVPHIIFPEIDAAGKQTHSYDDTRCVDASPTFLDHRSTMQALKATSVVRTYFKAPNHVNLLKAHSAFDELAKILSSSPSIPSKVHEELSLITLPQLEAAGAAAPKNAELHLRSIHALDEIREYVQHLFSAGAADCRAAQIDVTTTSP